MRRKLLWIPVVVVTFIIGAVFVAIYRLETAERIDMTKVEVEDNGCSRSKTFPGRSRRISKITKDKGGFFPKEAFSDGLANGDEYSEWYVRFLRKMREKSLLDFADGDTEVYRFLWLRTFDHPVALTVIREGHSLSLISKELDGAGGYEPGNMLRTDNIWLTEDQWCTFRQKLERAGFWTMPGREPDDLGNDGAQWILEGVNDGRYHVVDRWSPRSGDYRAACLYLIELSGRSVDNAEERVY